MSEQSLACALEAVRQRDVQRRTPEHPRITFAAPQTAVKSKLRYSESEMAQLMDAFVQRHPAGSLPGLSVLEIGLDSGATHCVWRQVAGTVVTVETDPAKAAAFVHSLAAPEGSHVVAGPVANPITARAVQHRFPNTGFDMLVINGPVYNVELLAALWALYEPRVKPGGMIVFPEASDEGSSQSTLVFLSSLKNGQYGDAMREVEWHFILDEGSRQGWAWYIKPKG